MLAVNHHDVRIFILPALVVLFMESRKKKLLILGVTAMVLTGFCVAPAVANPLFVIGGVELITIGVVGISAVAVAAGLQSPAAHASLEEAAESIHDAWTGWFAGLAGWIDVTSEDGERLLASRLALYENTPAGPDGKKKGEWFFKVKRDRDTLKIKEVNKNGMTEDQAVEFMNRQGGKKDVLAINKDVAKDAGARVGNGKLGEINRPHKQGRGYFKHYHPNGNDHSIHLFVWEPKP